MKLLYLTEVSQLSCSKVLKGVVKLKDELCIFLLQKDKCSKYVDVICDDNLCNLSYLVMVLQ